MKSNKNIKGKNTIHITKPYGKAFWFPPLSIQDDQGSKEKFSILEERNGT